MKKGLIITNAFYINENTKHQVERLKAEFRLLDVEIEVVSNFELPVYIEDDVISVLPKSDFIIYLDKDKHIARMLEKVGHKLFNSATSIELCDDKMLTLITLANNNIKIPKTISSPLLYPSVEDEKDFINKISDSLTFPIVVKECHGSLGRQVYKADNIEELKTLREKLKHVPHLYQELIQNSFGRDVRVIVVGSRVIASMLRVSESDFRSNINLGGKGYNYDLPKNFEKAAIKISKILDLDYCGIDFLIGENNEPYICEVNSNAFFSEIEKVSGKNIAKEYAMHIYEKIYGKSE